MGTILQSKNHEIIELAEQVNRVYRAGMEQGKVTDINSIIDGLVERVLAVEYDQNRHYIKVFSSTRRHILECLEDVREFFQDYGEKKCP